MAHGKRRRGSGGHPARVAERRRQNEAAHASGSSELVGLAREVARTAAGLGAPLDAELWASQLLGMFWRGRYGLPFTEGVTLDPALEYGEPLLRQLARIGDRGAAIAVLALAELEDGELGTRAKETLDSAGLWPKLPRWAAEVGESVIVGAAVMRDPVFDDGQTVFLESRHRDGEVIALGVLIDRNLGGMAKDVLLADSIELVEQSMRAHAAEQPVELVFERIEPGVAAGLIRDAIAVTDMTWDPPVEDDYWNGRAVALLRSDQTPGVVTPEDQPEISPEERDALRAEFLSSPEGSGFDADGDAAWTASLAINFAADYAGGDPLRWSPVVVELFLVDWVPRKVLTTPELLAALPGALDAWVRFAARRRGVPDSAAALTREAIPRYVEEMRTRASDPDVGGPSKRLMLAMQEAGVDPLDEQALETFIAGWNARSELDAPAGWDLGENDDAELDGQALEDMVVQIKVQLSRVTKPPVWRRLQVPLGTPLDQLHEIIQAAFGWDDYHLHAFEAGGEQFGPADPELQLDFADERRFMLADLVIADGNRITYTYDFGDGWDHDIRVEKSLQREPDTAYPLLVTAKGACPPEDCGGVWGWSELKEVLADPDDAQYAEQREWLGLADGDVLDPTAVDEDEIRSRLAGLSSRIC